MENENNNLNNMTVEGNINNSTVQPEVTPVAPVEPVQVVEPAPVENTVPDPETTPNVESVPVETPAGSVVEEPKKKSKLWIIILVLVVLGVGGYFAYDKFIADNDEKDKQEEKDNEKQEDTNLKTVFDEKGLTIKEEAQEDGTSYIYINNIKYFGLFVKAEVYDNNFAIIEDGSGMWSKFFVVDMNGELLKDINGKSIISGEESRYTWMEFKDNKLYYKYALILDIDEHSHAEVICGKYPDDEVVSKKYSREYLGNGKFGEEVLVSSEKVSDAKSINESLEEYCSEMADIIKIENE